MGSKAPGSSPGSATDSHDTPPSRLRKAALLRVDRVSATVGSGKLWPPVWVTAIRKSGFSGLAAIQGSLNWPGPTRRFGPTTTSGVWAASGAASGAARWTAAGINPAAATPAAIVVIACSGLVFMGLSLQIGVGDRECASITMAGRHGRDKSQQQEPQ